VTAATPFQMMERTRIHPSPLNPRKHFDPAKLQGLAGTMGNDVGIIEPLVVRTRPDLNGYGLVAGERRWRAAAIAGLELVPVLVKELTDAQVLEIMVIENNQREDITPLEEASGFKQLLQLGQFDVDALAGRLGRSRKYVYDRMKLLALIPAAQQLLEAGRITAGHAILLARLTLEQQAAAIDPKMAAEYDGDGLFEYDNAAFDGPAEKGKKADPYARLKLGSVRSFQGWIRNHVRLNLADPETQQEFPHLVAAVEKAVAVVHISFEYGWNLDEAVPDGGQPIHGIDDWRRADGKQSSKKCDHAVTGVVVVGRDRGTSMIVCVEKECRTHWPKAATAGRSKHTTSSPSKRTPTAAEKRWKAEQEKEHCDRKAWEQATPDIIAACAARVAKAPPAVLGEFILEVDYIETDDLKKADALLATKKTDAAAVLQRIGLAAIISQAEQGYSAKSFAADAKKRLGVDVAPILKKVQTSAKAAEAKAGAKKPGKKAAA
jgi:ParB/RepB/Spo0J family partition protein